MAELVNYKDLSKNNSGVVAVDIKPFTDGEIEKLTKDLEKYALVCDGVNFFIYGQNSESP